MRFITDVTVTDVYLHVWWMHIEMSGYIAHPDALIFPLELSYIDA
jgi:hypothetical protein